MNALTLFTRKTIVQSLMIFYTLAMFSSTLQADEKSLDNVLKHEELVLTLSDDVLTIEEGHLTSSLNGYRKQTQDNADQNKPVNVGCGMDLSPFGTTSDNDNSLSSRLVGECNLNYKY